jgi:hypothetical protein
MDRQWHTQNPDYDAARRLSAKLERAKADNTASVLEPPRVLPGLAWDVVQDTIGVQSTEIIGEVVRVAGRRAQDAMQRQVADLYREFGRLPRPGA